MNATQTETNILNELQLLRKENKELKKQNRMYQNLHSKLNKMYNELKQKIKILR
jgi:hypothetical protein